MNTKPAIKMIPYLCFVFLMMSNCTAISSSEPSSADVITQTDLPSRWQLRRNFYEKGEILIVYNASDREAVAAYDSFLNTIANEPLGRRNRNVKILHKLSTELTDEEIKNNVLFLIGTPSANTLVSRLATALFTFAF